MNGEKKVIIHVTPKQKNLGTVYTHAEVSPLGTPGGGVTGAARRPVRHSDRGVAGLELCSWSRKLARISQACVPASYKSSLPPIPNTFAG